MIRQLHKEKSPYKLRPELKTPITYTVLEPAEASDATAGLANMPHTWKWHDIPVPWTEPEGCAPLNAFPLPIACIRSDGGTAYLLSGTALWHLLPTKDPVGTFLGPRHEVFWEYIEDLAQDGALESEVYPSKKALLARARVNGETNPAQYLQSLSRQGRFIAGMFMVTPRMLIGVLAWHAKVPKTATDVQKAAFAMLDTFLVQCRLSTFVGLEVQDNCLDARILRDLLSDISLRGRWEQKAVLQPPALEGRIPLTWLVWVSFRWSTQTGLSWSFAKAVFHELVICLDRVLPSLMHDTLPTCRLPKDCRVNISIAKALRGDDKTFLLYNSFLGRNIGKLQPEEAHLLGDIAYGKNFDSYRNFLLRAMGSAYMSNARIHHCKARVNVSYSFTPIYRPSLKSVQPP